MGILDRISSILRANINDALDHAENPEAMLNQILRDMEGSLRQADSDIADQIAQQKMTRTDLDTAKRQSDGWRQKAELAVNKSMDDLAREALLRAKDFGAQADVYQKQSDAQAQAIQELKSKRDALQSKYESAIRNRDMLIARAKRAQATERLTQATAKANKMDYSSDMHQMERRIQEMEARADAHAEVAKGHTDIDDKFAGLERDDDVEKELAELKQKLGKT